MARGLVGLITLDPKQKGRTVGPLPNHTAWPVGSLDPSPWVLYTQRVFCARLDAPLFFFPKKIIKFKEYLFIIDWSAAFFVFLEKRRLTMKIHICI